MPRKRLYRITKPGQHAIRHPESEAYFVPDPSKAYQEDDPLVVQYPYLFECDEDRVEEATAEPGERRRVKRDRDRS